MVEQPSYKIIKKIEKVEIREYPACITAKTELPVNDRNAAFGRIAGYIFGRNKEGEKIPMTAPVIMSSSKKTGKFTMRFIMPKKYSIKSLPKPNSKEVIIEKIPKRKLAVLGFSGFMSDSSIKEKTDRLIEVLNKSKVKYKKEPFFMGYNPPWTLPFFRRNEVAVEVD